MSTGKPITAADKHAAMLVKIRREVELRQSGYRERALKLFPHLCASCGREFTGKRLQELTVHHKDGNHQNNPNDGSNWELLCIYFSIIQRYSSAHESIFLSSV